jgi:branched-chain amino acid transport system substrate-binding protein
MSRKIIISLVIVSLLLSACGGPSEPKGEAIVYVAAPLSGFQANGGQTVLGGVRLQAEQINKAGGLLGYRVEVVPLDDESDSEVAVKVAEQISADLAAGKRVLGVIGHYNSGQTLAAMEVYKNLPIVVITPTASEVSLTQKGYRNFFRINANDIAQANVDADFLVNNLGKKSIAVLHNDTEYGVGLRDQIRPALERLGARVVTSIQVAEGQGAYAKEVEEVKASGAEAIFYAGYEIECPYLRYDLKQAGVEIPFLASDGCFLSATIDESGGAAEGMYVSAFAPSPWATVDKPWVKAYQAVEYRNPDTYSISGYSAMTVLAEGAKKAGTLEAAKVAEAIRGLQLDTLIGRVSYDPQGDLKEQKVYIFQVQGSEFKQVFP